ncbi:DUF3617 domain-containing protein [Sphingomonas sp.]|jgi:hypothetical protein|uniref:DUF3617 domain-containing protein n=1 Tax=Sphingomonas sp. TaxID=28214 RepID=UPI003B3A5DA5
MGSMKLGSIVLLTGAAMLAGCNKKPDDVSLKDASVEKVANTAQNAVKMQPGQWEMSFAIDKMEIPGMPAGSSAPKAEPTKATTCVTPEQAAKPAGDMFAGKGMGDCKFDHFTMNGGKMDAAMTCKMPQGESKTTMTGTYSSTSFSNEVTSTVNMPNNQKVTVHATSAGKRIGECPKAS